jgi:hypothetical protein
MVVDIVNSMGDLESDLSTVTPIEYFDIYYFQRIILSSYEDHLEAMVKDHEHSSLSMLSSLKNETHNHEHSSLSMSSSLKVKQITMSIVHFLCQAR